jgi:hypothetical protein
MKTCLILALLLPLAASAQCDQFRAIPPEQIDPYQVFLYQRPCGQYKTLQGGDACVVLVAIKETGELVRIVGSVELCRAWPKGTEMNFSRQEVRNDSIQ